ncbi:MAG TPA: Hsp70 family protein [Acidimicrobiales bacterium]|nr:Hsp70 family protein [Acidimicrobiales bacterium]
MGYSLGIDVGATTCAAALCRGTSIEPCVLGDDAATMPAVALPRPDGSVLVGHDADRRCTYEPTLVGRMVTAGLLDADPVVIGGEVCHPLPLTEALLDEVIERASAGAGGLAEHVMVSYPLRADGGPERLLAEAAHRVTGGAAVLVPAPIAAAAKLAHDHDLGPDALVAVVDFGGSSVDVTLVRCTPEVFDLVGDPASLTDVGGVDLDSVVVTLAEGAIGDVTSTISSDDTVGMLALRRMRASCRDAKERLSTDDVAVVDVALPRARAQIEITREAFERAVARLLDAAVDLVLSTIDGAGLIPDDVDVAMLVGGSARIPRVHRLVAERTDIPVVVDDEPELSVAMGAALFGDVADLMPGVANVPTPAPMRAEAAPVEPPPVEPPAAPVLRDGVPDPGPLPAPVPPAAPAPVADPFAESPFLAGLRSLGGPPADEPPPGRPLGPELQADTRPAAPPPPPALPPDPPPSDPPPPPRPPPVPPLRTGEIWPAAVDAGWSDDGHGGFDAPGATDDWPAPEGQWQDTRTSVFEPAPPPAPPAPDAAGDPDDDWGQAPAEAFRRLTTSDTDPFGSWAGARSTRWRECDDDDGDGEDLGGNRSSLDLRLVAGGAAAAVFLVILAAFAVLSGAGDDSDPIAVADTVPTTASPTTEAATSGTAALTSNSTTTSSTTTTTEEDEDEPVTTLPQPTAPPPAPTIVTAPPPPTTRPTTTTTRPPTTTTSTSTTTTTSPTTTDPPGPPGPPGPSGD